jgi:hypothetical protein
MMPSVYVTGAAVEVPANEGVPASRGPAWSAADALRETVSKGWNQAALNDVTTRKL